MRFALLLDGAFVVRCLEREGRGSEPRVKSVHASVTDIGTRCRQIMQHPLLAGHELLRVYFYDAPPARETVTNPVSGRSMNLARTDLFARSVSLQAGLSTADDVALRLGELAIRGWVVKPSRLTELARTGRALSPDDLKPQIVQKGVDLRIGLDIARLSLRRLVDALVVVTGDSDLVPAFKFARREGIRVYLDHLGNPIKPALRVHVDRVL